MAAATETELKKPRGRMTPFAFYVFVVMEQCRKKYPDKNLIFKRFEKVCSKRWEEMERISLTETQSILDQSSII